MATKQQIEKSITAITARLEKDFRSFPLSAPVKVERDGQEVTFSLTSGHFTNLPHHEYLRLMTDALWAVDDVPYHKEQAGHFNGHCGGGKVTEGWISISVRYAN